MDDLQIDELKFEYLNYSTNLKKKTARRDARERLFGTLTQRLVEERVILGTQSFFLRL